MCKFSVLRDGDVLSRTHTTRGAYYLYGGITLAVKDAYYFSHDSNARHDPKIVKMLTKYPYGYQWYFMIIEILREQSDYKYKMDAYYGNAIARELHTDCKTVESFVQDCIAEFKLFLSDGKSFWSGSLLKR